MRRSRDGYISATGMFKATFPWAEVAEEEMERKYIKSLESTSPDETAGNVWIPPQHALELAAEYGILPWIQALLDHAPIEVNPTKDATPKSISPPPKFLMPQETFAAPSPTRRSRRSASPSKMASPRKTAGATRPRRTKAGSVEPSTKAATKDLEQAIADTDGSEVDLKTSEKVVEKIEETTEEKTEEKAEEKTEEVEEKAEEKAEEAVARVTVDTDVEVKGDVETTHTHVEVEMPAGLPEAPSPEDTQAMIAKAKEMVAEATKSSNAAGPSNVVRKRKAEEVEEDEDEEKDESADKAAPAKKAKVESELKKEKVKTRALIGISATLAIGYAHPFLVHICYSC